MKKKDTVAPLLEAIRDSARWLAASGVRGAVVGGVAASLHGRPRVTNDVDLLVIVDQEEWGNFLKKGRPFGITARTKDALKFAKFSGILLARHKPSGLDIDVSLGSLPFELEVVQRAKMARIRGVKFRLATPEDIIIMKVIASRPRDMADVEGILDAAKRLDLKRIRKTVSEFSAVLETYDFSSQLERQLKRRKK